MHQLIQNGKVIFESARKVDVIYEHIRYRRRDRVRYRYKE